MQKFSVRRMILELQHFKKSSHWHAKLTVENKFLKDALTFRHFLLVRQKERSISNISVCINNFCSPIVLNKKSTLLPQNWFFTTETSLVRFQKYSAPQSQNSHPAQRPLSTSGRWSCNRHREADLRRRFSWWRCLWRW